MTYKLEAIIPSHLVASNPQLINFLRSYYEWMEQPSNPSQVISSLKELRDVDLISEELIQFLQREFAQNIPKNLRADKRKLYKNIIDLYRSRGSIPSFVAGFNVLFNEDIELYYPRVDILKPSDGKWDNATQKWLSNDGFLSDTKYIQDSYFYQSFSYVIKTGQGVDVWRDYVKKILHPSGFIFFGEILIQSIGVVTAKGPVGVVGESGESGRFIIESDVTRINLQPVLSEITKQLEILNSETIGPTMTHFDQNESNNEDSIYHYYEILVGDAVNGGDTIFSTPSEIDLEPNE